MRQVIAELREVASLHKAEQELLAACNKLIPRLREANEHLLLATFGAQDLQAAAEESVRKHEEFVAMVAHELRSPLQPVAAANGVLGRLGDAHPTLPRLHAVIERQVSHMARLVDDLLDMDRIRTGKMSVAYTELILSDIIDSALETTIPLMEQRGQRLHLALPETPVMLHGDLVRLTQVFANLLVNASKFTQDGGEISVGARLAGNQVRVWVKDNGRGIAPPLLPRIFELYAQGRDAHSMARGGLGIGLALVHAIAEMHGGSVHANSPGMGLGSTFTVTLPVVVAAPAD